MHERVGWEGGQQSKSKMKPAEAGAGEGAYAHGACELLALPLSWGRLPQSTWTTIWTESILCISMCAMWLKVEYWSAA